MDRVNGALAVSAASCAAPNASATRSWTWVTAIYRASGAASDGVPAGDGLWH